MSEVKMKPFNLERALAGDPVVYRNGEKVAELLVFNADIKYPVHTLDECGLFATHTKDGTYESSMGGGRSRLDLFMAVRTKTLWVNVYHSVSAPTGLSVIGYLYATKEEAEENRGPNSISAPIEVEY